MEDFTNYLERFFAWTNALQARLSEHWRAGVNTRTIIIIVVCGAIAALSYVYLIEPPASFPTGQIITIPSGASTAQVGELLQQGGVVRNALAFKIVVSVLGRERGVFAGDYLFKEPVDLFSVAHALSTGQFGLVPLKIRIPEGATMKQMSLIYSAQLQRFNAANFVAQTPQMEGYLFPDTYFFLPDATEDVVIQAMRQNFTTQIAALQPSIASSSHSLSDIITMASIVEKEASNTTDRRMIAGVLWRRIKLGMPLQSDVTIIYQIGKPDSLLTLKDLQSDLAYNSYFHKGLPPTPINSPSLDSIEAAMNPIDDGYLYYMADRSGVTHYAKTYAQQLRNERIYLGH